jgi:pimeloyl-ACP methyl ester carboxylesterase
MFRRRPDLVAMSVPGAGHDVHLEHPEALRRAVQDFLGSLTTVS